MYHVSRMDLGEIVTLAPGVPKQASPGECRNTLRVCFAPSVEQCVIGLVGYAVSQDITFLGAFSELANSQRCPTVYWTDEDLITPDPTGDYLITGEAWALYPVLVERIGYIDCMAMLRERRIVIRDYPTFVDVPDQELAYSLSDGDRSLLLHALSV